MLCNALFCFALFCFAMLCYATYRKSSEDILCTHMCTPVHTCAYTHVHTCAHMCTPVHTCAHLCTIVHTCAHLYTLVHAHMCTPVHTCAHVDAPWMFRRHSLDLQWIWSVAIFSQAENGYKPRISSSFLFFLPISLQSCASLCPSTCHNNPRTQRRSQEHPAVATGSSRVTVLAKSTLASSIV